MKVFPPLVLVALGLLLVVGNVDGCSIHLPLPIQQVDLPGSFVIVVEETGERTTAMSKIMASDFWSGLETRGLKFRPYDDDAEDAKPYLGLCKSIPWLIILGPDGAKLRSEPMPQSIDALDKVVKEATGR